MLHSKKVQGRRLRCLKRGESSPLYAPAWWGRGPWIVPQLSRGGKSPGSLKLAMPKGHRDTMGAVWRVWLMVIGERAFALRWDKSISKAEKLLALQQWGRGSETVTFRDKGENVFWRKSELSSQAAWTCAVPAHLLQVTAAEVRDCWPSHTSMAGAARRSSATTFSWARRAANARCGPPVLPWSDGGRWSAWWGPPPPASWPTPPIAMRTDSRKSGLEMATRHAHLKTWLQCLLSSQLSCFGVKHGDERGSAQAHKYKFKRAA